MFDMKPAKILVGVASGEEADAALDYAVAEARRRGLGVHLVHAMDPVLLAADPQTWALVEGSLREAATQVLERAARRVEAGLGDGGAVSTELVHGPAVPALAALSRSAARVVLQRRPATRWHGAPLSVTNGVAARSRVPVLVVPTGWQERRAAAPLTVGVKDPALSGEVVRAALSEAQARAAGLRIVHAWHYSSAFDDLVFEGDARVEHEAHLRTSISQAVQEIRADYPDVEVEIAVEHCHPGDLMTRESQDACLVVLGRHQTRVGAMPHLGSVVRAVLRGSECPTMVVDPMPETERAPDSSPATKVAWPERAEVPPVVAAVNGSAGSDSAVRKAVHEARSLRAPVRLVHVVPDYVPVSPMMPLTPADLTETGLSILKDADRVARAAAPDVDVETRLVRGSRVPRIVEDASDAQLLVVGQDRSFLERLVSGRTAAGVAVRSSCPVEQVASDWQATPGHGAVVVGVESAQDATPLLAQAVSLAAARRARLVVLHAWKMPTGYDDIIESRVAAADIERRFTADIEPLLAAQRAHFPEVPVEVRVVHDRPAHALVRASEDADLLVLMRRPHLMPDAWHLGGTALAVLRAAQCTVRIVPPLTEDSPAGAPIGESAQLSGAPGR